MGVPKFELVSEGVKHKILINGIDMNSFIRKAVIVVEANNIISYRLSFGDDSADNEINVTTLGSESVEYASKNSGA